MRSPIFEKFSLLVPCPLTSLKLFAAKQVVRDSQEAMSVLIAEYMDLELHQQILCNKVYSLFLSLGQTYHTEQTALWEESLQVFYIISLQSLCLFGFFLHCVVLIYCGKRVSYSKETSTRSRPIITFIKLTCIAIFFSIRCSVICWVTQLSA